MDFVLDSIETHLADTVARDDVMLTTDISRAYYSVPIVAEATPFLAIKHRGEFYAPVVLPFGSSLAPFIFTRITKQVVRLAHTIGLKVLNFYDDFLWAAPQAQGKKIAEFVKWSYRRRGGTSTINANGSRNRSSNFSVSTSTPNRTLFTSRKNA